MKAGPANNNETLYCSVIVHFLKKIFLSFCWKVLLFEALKVNRCDYVSILLDRGVKFDKADIFKLYQQVCTVFCIPYWILFLLTCVKGSSHSISYKIVSVLCRCRSCRRCHWANFNLIWQKGHFNNHAFEYIDLLWSYFHFQFWFLIFNIYISMDHKKSL